MNEVNPINRKFLAWVESLSTQDRNFITGILKHDDYPKRLIQYANILQNMNDTSHYRSLSDKLAKWALELSLENDEFFYEISQIAHWHVRKQVPLWHYSILADTLRNEAYKKALEQFIVPGESIVFEIGTGSGILSMMAARAGAKHVYTCESEPLLAHAARENFCKNGYQDQITLFAKSSFDVELNEDLPYYPDIIVCEIIDNYLIGENILPIMQDIQNRLMGAHSVILPKTISVKAVLIDESMCNHASVKVVDGFDLSSMNRFSPKTTPIKNGYCEDDFCSNEVMLFSIDLNESLNFIDQCIELDMQVSKHANVGGVLHWINFEFDSINTYSGLKADKSSWTPIIHLFNKTIDCQKGDVIPLSIDYKNNSLQISIRSLH